MITQGTEDGMVNLWGCLKSYGSGKQDLHEGGRHS
jgi:hypothetical protein